MKRFASAISMVLVCALALTACGGSSSSSSASQSTAASTSTSTSGASGSSSGYTFLTSADNKVVTENGEVSDIKITTPVLVTSMGQSADVSMLDALMKKCSTEYTFNATASAEEVAGYKTVIIACGASSKGLGAAGISQEDELARADAIAKVVKENDITVIVAHLGGAARRGALSDKFNDIALSVADYILVVEEGNDDGKFTDAATTLGVPVTLLHSIADALTPLNELFGTK